MSVRLHRGHRRLGDGELAATGATGWVIPGVVAPRVRGEGIAASPTAGRNLFSMTAGMSTHHVDVCAGVTGTVIGRHNAFSVTATADSGRSICDLRHIRRADPLDCPVRHR